MNQLLVRAQQAGARYGDDLQRIHESAELLTTRATRALGNLFGSLNDDDGSEGATVFYHRQSDSTEPAVSSAPPHASPEAPRRGSLDGTILVADDNEPNRELLTRRLSREGCTVAVAGDGRRALDMMRRHAFDVILLDMLMPEMSGYEVLMEMKADPKLRHLPVIMISGLDDAETPANCIESGADDYLTKPFDPILLRARVGACLEKKQLRDREQEHLSQIEEERRRADELLHVIFPESIAAELKASNHVKPRQHENVAVLFTDVTGFTSYCDKNPPETVIDNLQQLVRRFEEIALRHGVEKIKTIGDAFMATSGLLTTRSTPVINCVKAGLEMCQAARELDCGWTVHVGIHVGPVIAGVVGERSYQFDVWGDTVNTAARVADLAGDEGVLLSERSWLTVSHLCTGTSAGRHLVKGKGEMEVFEITSATPPMS